MSWTANSEWERWDPEKLVVCPYDPSHRIAVKRFQRHLVKCRKNHPDKDFVSCPFNASHKVLRLDLYNHICKCPDKNFVEAYPTDFEADGKLKGNTSLPDYKTSVLSDRDDEDWDAEIAASQQEMFPAKQLDLVSTTKNVSRFGRTMHR
ncbi:gametocyte-specific factor 1-like [Xenia sp. Carnegie-2017]|uniref:gametocyte-specific factor 1-like n=1 Tax=Xenia sp. Carnegie-2017 TaxID=2897299 RepID=UPI001F03DF15|nr:gametocyte-specific factor 1-like [Xenia sp. Carnegie-2017]XP_046844710.1 gametocyte-specific factor 1-like [Xenia sp. Carnegie-2017]